MLITGILSTVLARYGLKHASKKNWLPKNHYQRNALDCLKNDDIAGAVKNNIIVRQKDPEYEEAQIVRELIQMALDKLLSDEDEAVKSGSDKIKAAIKEIRFIKLKQTAVYLLLSLIVTAFSFIPVTITLFTGFQIDNSLYYIISYAVLLTGGFFILLKSYLFNPKKSPLLHWSERMETLKRKIGTIEKSLDKSAGKQKLYTKQKAELVRDNASKG